MPIIRPCSDLRNHFKDIERDARTGEPIFLTNKGRASMVLLSNEAYDALCANTNKIKAGDIAPSPEQMQMFGEVITNLMTASKLTDEDMSAKTDITEDKIYNICEGCYMPDDAETKKLADALCVKPDTLFYFMEEHTDKTAKAFQRALANTLDKLAKI